MNPVLAEMLRSGQVMTSDGLAPIHSHISPEEGEFLQEIVLELQPTTSLEVGLAFGVSAHFICEALEKCGAQRHIVIDPNQYGDRWNGVGILNLQRAGYERLIDFHNAPSHEALPRIAASGVKIEFAFVDGSHTFDYALLDFFYIDRMLRVGGVVAFDDAHYASIRKLCRFIAVNRAYRVFKSLRPEVGRSASRKVKVLRYLARKSGMIRSVLSPEVVRPDSDLGLIPNSRCIALRKEAEDSRAWDFHAEF